MRNLQDEGTPIASPPTLPGLPGGTITFLFTDVEGSTRLLQHLKADYAPLLDEQQRILRQAIAHHAGQVVDTQGDSFFAAFSRALDALHAVIEAQNELATHAWPDGADVRVRMALHTGEPLIAGDRYIGMDVHRAARIGAAGHGGQVLLSQTTRDLVDGELPAGVTLRDLGEHRLKDLRRPNHLFQLVIADLPSEFPPLKTLDARPNNLPLQLTSFIGRDRELGEVKRLLAATRLLTLSGVGGTGKTRLALQAAAELLEEFQHGVWLVELAPVADPELVPQTVASALELRELAGRSATEALADFLEPRELLLLLDNCEHLLEASARFAEPLLRHCPRLRILTTSREPLGIAGEVIWSVPSLSLPHGPVPSSPAELEQFEAVRLFTERARAVQPNFALGSANAAAVAQVCLRLDGIPLALELAAARVRGMGVEQIAARLDNRFRLLTGGSRTALPRQQTLGALIDWSYDLLTEAERRLFRRLAVFAGPFPLDAVEAVCGGGADESFDTLDLLLRLVDKSLVLTEERHGETFYRLLETIRQYGREKLLASGEAEPVGDRHAQYFLRLAEASDRALRGPEQVAWLNRLDVLHDNFRAALEWWIETRQTQAALELACKHARFWFVRSDYNEGRQWLERVLAQEEAPRYPAAYADALAQLAHLTWLQIGAPPARRPAEQALTIARAFDDRLGVARALVPLSLVCAHEGKFAEAESGLQESQALFQELDDEWGTANALICMASVMHWKGDQAAAVPLFEQARAGFRTLGDAYFQSVALRFIGEIRVRQGEWQEARAPLREALKLSRKLGSKFENASVLWVLGELARRAGNPGGAVRLYWAARNIYDSIGAWRTADNPEFEEVLAACRAALADTEFTKAVKEGGALTMDQAIEYALSVTGPSGQSPDPVIERMA